MSDYRPSCVGDVFYLQLGENRQKVLMRVTELDDQNFKATSASVDYALTAKPPIPTIVWTSET